MTIISTGYAGTLAEAGWGDLAPKLGTYRGVDNPNHLTPTVSGSNNVTIGTGSCYGDGIRDKVTAAESVTLSRPTSGTRYDCVALRRDWQSKTTTVVVIQGSNQRLVPTLQDNPGAVTEQAICLVSVPAGTASVAVSDDLRVTWGDTANVYSKIAMVGSPAGSRFILDDGQGTRWTLMPSGVMPDWEPPQPELPKIPLIRAGTSSISTTTSGVASIRHNLGWVPDVVTCMPRLTTDSGMLTVTVDGSAGSLTTSILRVVVKRYTATGWAPYFGGLSYVDWIAYKFT